MEVYIFEEINPIQYHPFGLENIQYYKLFDIKHITENEIYISDYIDKTYTTSQTSHNYRNSLHLYSYIICTINDKRHCLVIITNENPDFNNIKNELRHRMINDIIKWPKLK